MKKYFENIIFKGLMNGCIFELGIAALIGLVISLIMVLK